MVGGEKLYFPKDINSITFRSGPNGIRIDETSTRWLTKFSIPRSTVIF